MARAVAMRVAGGWDPRFTRMIGVSAFAHAALVFVVLVVLPLVHPAPLMVTGYTVELIDPSALGGKPPPGRPDQPLGPRPGPSTVNEPQARLGEPAAKSEPPPTPPPSEATKPEPPPKPPEPAKEPPKPVEPTVKLPSPEKPPPPKPEAKKPPEPRPEPPKPEAKKPEPPPKPEPKAAEASSKPPATTAAKPSEAKPAEAKPADTKPAEAKPADTKPAGTTTGKPEGSPSAGADAYAAAAQKWHAKGATGGGGGLGGTEPANGPAGLGGYGGGGQVVGAEFIAYVQRISELIRAAWVSPVVKSGLTAKVRCAILPNGEIASVELAETSGDSTFDTSVVRAVRRAAPLPPPPSRYLGEFREGVVVNFNSDELARGAG